MLKMMTCLNKAPISLDILLFCFCGRWLFWPVVLNFQGKGCFLFCSPLDLVETGLNSLLDVVQNLMTEIRIDFKRSRITWYVLQSQLSLAFDPRKIASISLAVIQMEEQSCLCTWPIPGFSSSSLMLYFSI